MSDETFRMLLASLSKRALPKLKTLWLNQNRIEDAGMRKLNSAIVRGAFPALQELAVSNNPASEGMQQEVRANLEGWYKERGR